MPYAYLFSRAGAPVLYGQGLEAQLGAIGTDELRGLGNYEALGAAPAEWPEFARGFAAFCKQNRKGIEPLATALQNIGMAVPGGLPLTFIGGMLVFFMEEGKPAAAIKTQAKIAKQYCDLQVLALGVLTLALPVLTLGAGLVVAPALAAGTAVMSVLSKVFGALSEGKSPKTEDMTQLLDLGGAKISDKLEPLKPVLRQLDKALGLGSKVPFLDDKIKQYKRAAAAAPPVPKGDGVSVKDRLQAAKAAQTAQSLSTGGSAAGPLAPVAPAASSKLKPMLLVGGLGLAALFFLTSKR